MIPFEFRYLRAESAEEAVAAWVHAQERGETVHYYGGGTEIITLARESKLRTDCVIDYKRVPEATAVETTTDAEGRAWLAIGAGVSLNSVVDRELHPLVSWSCRGIADRTVRNSITLGGNICGMLPYRETVLPWLVMGGLVETVSVAGRRRRPMVELFDKRLRLDRGELALRFLLPAELTADAAGGMLDSGEDLSSYGPRTADGAAGTVGTPSRHAWFYERRTKDPRVDYPLVTLAMLVRGEDIRVALSGAWGYPARAFQVENAIREAGGTTAIVENAGADRATSAARSLITTALDTEEHAFRNDQRGSADYRRALTTQAIVNSLERIAQRNGANR